MIKKTLRRSWTVLKHILFYYPLYGLSFLTPRKKNRWVFGTAHGFSDNSKYLFIDVIKKHKDIEAIWISRDKVTPRKLQSLGYNAHYIWSFKGFYYLLTASTYITTHTFINSLLAWTLGRANFVNLWHGIALKNMQFRIQGGPDYKIFNHRIYKLLYYPIYYPRYIQPDLFLQTSSITGKNYQESFKLKEESLFEANYPRCEILTMEEKDRINFIQKHENAEAYQMMQNLKNYRTVFIYMPTWRSYDKNYLQTAEFNFEKLNDLMKRKNEILLLKLHPLTPMEQVENLKKYSNIIVINSKLDIYPLLPYTDVLITDYSSIYFDYMHLKNNHTIFFPFDYKNYVEGDYGLAYEYDSSINGIKVTSFNQLLNSIETKSYKNFDVCKKQELYSKFWGKPEDKQDLIRAIRSLSNKG